MASCSSSLVLAAKRRGEALLPSREAAYNKTKTTSSKGMKSHVALAVWLLAAVAGVLLAAQQVQRHRRPALFSLARAERAIRAEKGLRDFWRGLDARAERSADELRQLHRVRLASGVGTAAESAAAVRDFRDARDWGSDGSDSRASVLADRPRRPDVGFDVAYRPVHGSRARVEELADAAAQGRTSQLGGKRAVAETDHGLFGTSLGGLVRNVFGGPHSKIAEMSAKRGARTGSYVWSALGQPRWDSRGDPIVSQGRREAVPERGLERAGVKVSNSLGELYKDVPASSKIQQKLSAQGEVHLMRLIDGLFDGAPWQGQQSLQHAQEARRGPSQSAQTSEALAGHNTGHNKESTTSFGGGGSFFADEHYAPMPRPNAGLVTKMLAPEAEVMAADGGSLAKQLKDDGMLVPSAGLFRDEVSPAHTPSSQVSAADTPPAVAPHHAAAAARSESGGGLARARSKAGGETDALTARLADGEPRGGRASRDLALAQRRLGMYIRRQAGSMHPRAAHQSLERRAMRRLRRSMRWRAGGRARAIKVCVFTRACVGVGEVALRVSALASTHSYRPVYLRAHKRVQAGERARAEEDAGFKLPAGQMLEAHLVPANTEKDVHTQVCGYVCVCVCVCVGVCV